MLDRVVFFQSWQMSAEIVHAKLNLTSLFFWYVYFDKATGLYSIHEDFVTFSHCPRTTVAAIYDVLIAYMVLQGIPMQNGRVKAMTGVQTCLAFEMVFKH